MTDFAFTPGYMHVKFAHALVKDGVRAGIKIVRLIIIIVCAQ